MSLMDEFKKIIHPYDDEDDDYEEDVGRDSEPTYFEPREPREPRAPPPQGGPCGGAAQQGGEHPRHHPAEGGAGKAGAL